MTSGNSVYCWRILLISSLVFFLVDFGFYLTVPAQTKIFEDIICRQYEAEGDCKVALVQSELAAVNGWKDTFDALPGILLSIPYGVLADRIGRKPCLLLGLLGVILGEIWARIVCMFRRLWCCAWTEHRRQASGHRSYLSDLFGSRARSASLGVETWSSPRSFA
jgi:MFS family permease